MLIRESQIKNKRSEKRKQIGVGSDAKGKSSSKISFLSFKQLHLKEQNKNIYGLLVSTRE